METLATIIGKKRTVNATKEELELIDTGAAAYSRGEHLTLDELKDGLDGHRR